MTPDDARSLVLLCLADVAPDADATGLQPAQDMRRALDLDSMDMLSLVTALSEGSAIEIPDADVEQLTTLGGAIEYLVAAPGSAAMIEARDPHGRVSSTAE